MQCVRHFLFRNTFPLREHIGLERVVSKVLLCPVIWWCGQEAVGFELHGHIVRQFFLSHDSPRSSHFI